MRQSLVFLFATAGFASVIATSGARPAAAPLHFVLRGAGAPFAKVRPATAHAPADKAVIEQYCLECHDADKAKGDLVLEGFDPTKAEQRADVSEKIIRKLRAGMMPPAGKERPPEAALDALAASLEARLDAAAEARPNPGRRSFQRLNRAEYTASIRDMLSLDIDAASFLPPDTISHNFDNIADVQ